MKPSFRLYIFVILEQINRKSRIWSQETALNPDIHSIWKVIGGGTEQRIDSAFVKCRKYYVRELTLF